MFDPLLDRKVKLCEVAAQMAADGDVSPCAAARIAVAKELREKAAFLRQAALRADKTAYMQRDRAHAAELDKSADKLEWEAKECTATE